MNISVKIRFFAVWNVRITVVIKKFWISVRNRDSKRQMSALRGYGHPDSGYERRDGGIYRPLGKRSARNRILINIKEKENEQY